MELGYSVTEQDRVVSESAAHYGVDWSTVDATGTGGLLAQVEGRSGAVLIAWLNAQPGPWQAAITHVAIDFSASYSKAVREALPNAVLVVDHFLGACETRPE